MPKRAKGVEPVLHADKGMSTACGKSIFLPVSKYPLRSTYREDVTCPECLAALDGK